MNKEDVKKQWHELVAAKTHDLKLVAGSDSGRWQRFDEAVGVDLLIKIQAHEYRLWETQSKLDAALAQVAVLREALECHGDHSPDCATEDIDGSAYECDCGFDEALSTAAAILGEKEKA